jgi:hypothetical protein
MWIGWQGEHDDIFWEHGDATFRLGGTTGYGDWTEHRCFDIRFDPASFTGKPPRVAPLEETILVPRKGIPLPESTKAEAPERNKGGRPRKDFWEDMLVEMFDQLWHGQLIPKTQADIESAMQDWLSLNDYEASERSIRQRAQRLWKVWTKEGNN